MPVQRCSKGVKSGWRWGKSGKCYTGPGAKKKAIRQGIAIEGPDKFAAEASDEDFELIISDMSISNMGRAQMIYVRERHKKKFRTTTDNDHFHTFFTGDKKTSEEADHTHVINDDGTIAFANGHSHGVMEVA